MTSKSTIFFIFAFLCCFFATTFSQPYPETCVIRYFSTPELELNRNYIFLDDDFVSPFVGWAWANDAQTERVTRIFTGLTLSVGAAYILKNIEPVSENFNIFWEIGVS